MDQHETLTKAPDEADVPGPSSSSQHHHRPRHQDPTPTVGGTITSVRPILMPALTIVNRTTKMNTPPNPTTLGTHVTLPRPTTTVGSTITTGPVTTKGLSTTERSVPTSPPTVIRLLSNTPASPTPVSIPTTPSVSTTARPRIESSAPLSPSSSALKSSGKPKYPHHTPDHLQTAQAFNKVHPLAAFSPSTATRRTEEQFLKHKQPRNQHLHRRLRSEGLSQLLCKNLCNCIQWLRKRILFLVDSLAFEIFIFLIITLNTIMMVAQTFAEVEIRGEWYFTAIDTLFLSIYVVEAMLKIIALGFSYFSDPWNKLDFFIMLTSALDFTLAQLKHTLSHSIFNQNIFRIFKVLKSLRALRAIQVLRSFRILRNLQEVTETLAGSLPSITAILILMFTCLLLFSVVLRALFRHSDPKRFQNIFTTVFTLFIMLTLDDWSYIYLDSWAQGAWYIVPILMIYIIIQYFIFLNLVIAVLVDNFQMALLRGLEKEKLERAARTQEKLLDDSMTELNKADAEEMSEDVLHNQLMEKKFGDMTDKQKELLFHFLQLVAGVEHLQLKFRSQACVIDEIVDTTFEAGEEDFRK
ncbi:PREDICTED: cation channel sperm-associated protein 1 [Elephantulus edwardii]|uniref:cation channel sperm-associated protein 1 n=1 Tax=Elephantulus edwardii TaxID=28737 RepID=UPI0003F05B40|nr:PREDICTED: cation channel sperm-associated protein 1 [Elephantulus edwardii]